MTQPQARPTLQAFAAIPGIKPPEGLPRLAPTHPFSQEEIATWRAAKAEAIVDTTRGSFTIQLRGDLAPKTVSNFVELSSSGYFNNTEIHRVVPNFVVQAGDPTGTGAGDPGYAVRCEVSSEPYVRGTVGMALSGKDTGGSQFFVALSPQPHLDGNYTVFGQVIQGMESVDLIEEGDRILEVSIVRE